MNRRARLLAAAWVCAALVLPAVGAAAEDDPFKAVAGYQVGQSRKPLVAVEDIVRAATADAAKRAAVERKLLALLSSKDATLHCKGFVCRQLALVGSAESVPVLAAHLTEDDQQLGFMARFALEQIPDPAALGALRKALGNTQGKTRVGIINSLGVRGDAAAVPALIGLLKGEAGAAAAAAVALGKIGGPSAVRALTAAREAVQGSLRAAVEDALLGIARSLLASGKAAEATPILIDLEKTGSSRHVKLAAFAALVAAEGEKAVARVLAAIAGQDAELRNTALRLAEELPGAAATRALAARVPSAPPALAVALLDVLAARADKAAASAVAEAAKAKDATVRLAALKALGSLGDATSVKPLTAVATMGQGAEAAAATQALVRLRGDDVDATILAAMKGAAVPARVALMRVLTGRASAAAVPMLLAAARSDADATIRNEALRALDALASDKKLPQLIQLLLGAKTDGERAGAEKAILSTLGRTADRAPAGVLVQKACAAEDTRVPARCSLIRIAARIGGPAMLAVVRDGTEATDNAVRNTVVRTLAAWDTAEPMADLLAIAKSTDNKVHKVLALRGFLRMTALPHNRAPKDSLKLYADAMALATEPQEKKTVLGELAKLKDPQALQMALAALDDKAVADEAAAAVVSVSRMLLSSHNKQAVAALKKMMEVAKGKEAARLAADALAMARLGANIAREGKATSPDGIEKDGAAGGDDAAIDGNKATYWDEVDRKKLYCLVITFPGPRRISAVSILAYGQHSFSPRDFDLLADGKVIRTVKNAQYTNAFLVLSFPVVEAKAIELKITGYYGASPAIRELGIYEAPKE